MSQCLLYILMQLLNHVSSGCEVSDILIVYEYNDPANECVCVCVFMYFVGVLYFRVVMTSIILFS